MDQGQYHFALPKPGPALKRVLIFYLASGVLLAAAVAFGQVRVVEWLGCVPALVMKGQVWRLVTAGLITSPTSLSHLFWTLVGFYFLSPDLESRWGGGRFIRFILVANTLGFVLATLADLAPVSWAAVHPSLAFGPGPALTAIALAWARLNRGATIRFFGIVPLKASTFIWVILILVALPFFGHTAVPEGAVAQLGGALAGFLFAGEPSPARAAYLKLRLAVLRRRAGGAIVSARDIVEGRAAPQARRSRGDRPPLRVVPGGLEDELRKRKPPKDKRYLN